MVIQVLQHGGINGGIQAEFKVYDGNRRVRHGGLMHRSLNDLQVAHVIKISALRVFLFDKEQDSLGMDDLLDLIAVQFAIGPGLPAKGVGID